jgi:hypothetical protein
MKTLVQTLISVFVFGSVAAASQSTFYCNGDISVVSGENGEVLNPRGDSFYLESTKNEVVRASLDGKVQFVKIMPFQKMKWNREAEGEEFPSRFKFTTDKKTWFAIEAATDSDDVVHHLFCQHD